MTMLRLPQLRTAVTMTLRLLLRGRLVLLLLFLVPSLFYTIIILTTTDAPIVFQLASVGDEVLVEVSKRAEALVFIGLASVGLLTAFLAMNLVQRDAESCRRLVICGYRTVELVAARLAVLLCIIVAVATYVVAVLPLFFTPERLGLVALGFVLGGWVYGCYGMLVGAIFRRDLEGILFVVLLANIDVGWLQNPIFYAEAQNQVVIRSLPAYFPSQVSMAAAFTEHSIIRPVLGALLYGLCLLLVGAAVYAVRNRRR